MQESALGGSGSPRDSSQQKVQQRVSMHDSYPSSIIKQVCGNDARWRIDCLGAHKTRWFLVTTRLERERVSQYVVVKDQFPTSELSDAWLKGFHCSSMEYSRGMWYLVMTKGKTQLKQSSFLCSAFPEHPLPNLSLATFNGSQWAILMTDLVPPQTIQRIEHLDRSALKDQLIKGKNVSFLAHGNGFWYVGLTERADRQVILHTPLLPSQEIAEYHSQGYRIVHVAYRANRRLPISHMSGPAREGPLIPSLVNKWDYPVQIASGPSFLVSPVATWTTLIGDVKIRRGCWYYEVRVLNGELCQIGWVRDGFEPDEDGGVGDDELSWSYDGVRTKKWHIDGKDYGNQWRANDVIGCLADMERRALTFFLNGHSLGVAYHHIAVGDGLYPALSLSKGASVSVNFGSSALANANLPSFARTLRVTDVQVQSLPMREGADSPRVINPWNCECHLLSNDLEVLHTGVWGTFRASVGVRRGKWYYELKLLYTGIYQIGWALGGFVPQPDKDFGVGDDRYSWSYDGSRKIKWHVKSEEYGEMWKEGDVVGCALDLEARTMSFYLNGQSLGVAYSNIETHTAEVTPAWSMANKHKCLLNFGAAPFVSLPPGYQGLHVDVSALPAIEGATEAPALENPYAADVHIASDGLEVVSLTGFNTVAANVRVRRGRWMYEVILGSEELFQIGWAASAFRPSRSGEGVGDDHASWAYDGHRILKWHNSRETKYGRAWRTGDCIGCLIDCDAGEVSFYLNGESLGVAFTGIPFDRFYGLRPALTLSGQQRCRVNFGRTPFKYPLGQFMPLAVAKDRTGSASSSGSSGSFAGPLDDSQGRATPLSPSVSRLGDSSGAGSGRWEIPFAELKMGDRLGEGHFGEVFAGVWRRTTRVAIKNIKKEKLGSGDMAQEAGLLINLPPHLNIVQFYGVCSLSDGRLAIVTELLENGSLIRFLHTRGTELSPKQLLGIAMQVAAGMDHLHSNSVIHRDLAARNILVGGFSYGNWVVKVADFGLSRLGNAYALQSSAVPVKWSAPEAISKRLFTRASDVWSFGIVLHELYSLGEVPYAFFDEETTYKKVKAGYRLDRPDLCPDSVYAVMRRCWHEVAEQRPSFTELFDQLESITPADAPAVGATQAPAAAPGSSGSGGSGKDEKPVATYIAYARSE